MSDILFLQSQDMMEILRIAIIPGGFIYFGIGVLVLWGSVIEKRREMTLKDFPTSKIRSLALGPVELKGEIRAKDEVFESPFSETPCVMYSYSIAEYSGGKQKNWVGVEHGKKAAEFYLDDGTGRVLVDPSGAEFDFRNQNHYTFQSSQSNPLKIDDFLEERDEIFENHYSSKLDASKKIFKAMDMRVGNANPTGTRRYTEEYLPLDANQVYVFGEAMKRDGEKVINIDEDTPAFKISDKSESEIVSGKGSSYVLGLMIGLIMFMIPGFAVLVFGAGPVFGVILSLLASVAAIGFNEMYELER